MTHPNARAAETERHARRAKVTSILLSGVANQTAIAEQLGVNQATISRDIRIIEGEWRKEAVANVAEAKGQDLQRLERLIAATWDDARKGHLGAIDRVVKLLERRAKMLGYDAPEQLNLGGDLTQRVEIVGVDTERI
jgi:predicted transcriptional regulator